ncbi:uncharacterized protein [Sylvia atricapilla]|uniref:uncharacterized protein n=1 Tax=Sylvia atricapilla TaxID=48155 RepID=UPI00339AE02C
MEPRELLEALVAVVATLGQLAATVAGPDGDVLLSTSPGSLHTALGTFISHLRDTLSHHGVTSLGQALAALGATPGATWAHVTAAARAWWDSVAALEKSWVQVAKEATELRDACGDAATAEATTAATAAARAGDPEEHATCWGTAVDNMKAVAWRLPVALTKEEGASAEAAHEARMVAATGKMVAATKSMEESMVASSQEEAATRRGQRAKVALDILEYLVAACNKATAFPREMQRRLEDINLALEGTREGSRDVPKALVTEAELLWKGSASLATRHLLGTLREIRNLVSSHSGDPGGSRSRVVAERCQRAIEDIPRLLGEQ